MRQRIDILLGIQLLNIAVDIKIFIVIPDVIRREQPVFRNEFIPQVAKHIMGYNDIF